MLSAFANEPDPALRLTREELAETAVLLLIAGHETTVNLITNGSLTLLRHPQQLDLLRREPELLPRAVEELLRYEPPVHMRERIPHVDIDVVGTKIPRHASVILALASGNRDPVRFQEPDRFDPTRPDIEHLGSARLVEEPPPYRRNAMLRGPRPPPIQL